MSREDSNLIFSAHFVKIYSFNGFRNRTRECRWYLFFSETEQALFLWGVDFLDIKEFVAHRVKLGLQVVLYRCERHVLLKDERSLANLTF